MKLLHYQKITPYILLIPALTILIGLFLGGVTLALAQSLGYFPILGLKEVTFQYYLEVWGSSEFRMGLLYSLYISLVSSLIAVLVGVLLAYQLVKLPEGHSLIKIIYKLPIIVPHIVVSLMIFLLFSQSGLIARIFFQLGWIDNMQQFPSLIFDKQGIGIILVYLWKEIPFIALMTYTVLKHVNTVWEEVAANLGASRKQIFWHVYLPLSLPAIGSAFIIVFAFSFGAFEVPFLLGPTYPRTLPVLAYQKYISSDLTQRPYTMVITMTITLIAFFLIYLYKRLLDRIIKYS